MFEAARRRSSTTSTTPTTPTTSTVAVAAVATATRVSYPPLSRYRCRASDKSLDKVSPAYCASDRRSRAHMCVCKPWPCAALSKVHNRSPATLP